MDANAVAEIDTELPGLDAGLEALETERLEAEITTLAGHIAAATCRWLLLVAEFDRREAWAGWGCKSCAHWLAWQCAMGLRAAREHVRVARALPELPAIRAAFAAGELSYSQARALTRVARPDVEEELLVMARHATAAQLEQLVAGYVKATTLREQARGAYENRQVVWWRDDDGSLVMHARLPADDGALVLEALRATADRLRDAARATGGAAEHGSAEPISPPRALLADALVELTRDAPDGSEGATAAGFEVTVNVDLESLAADGPGTCRLSCGTVLAPETARRLACDQPIVPLHERDGESRRSGRRTRFASPQLNRVLDRRDEGCRFPGCTHDRYLHTHHIVHWAHGGATRPDNLVRLCSHHHRLVHEGGYAISGDPDGELVFSRPDGRRVTHHPRLRGGRTSALRELNRRNGADPQAGTITPTWYGDRLNRDWAVTALANSPLAAASGL